MGLVIDLFAGGGGASEGIRMALGRDPDIAVNHDPEAIAMHMANHPGTKHYVCDIHDVDPVEACGGIPVDLLWASPDCTHHSKAKGGKPRDRKLRFLAWAVVDWAEKVHPAVICLENVEEFRSWGPLDPNGYPIKAMKGKIFDSFTTTLRNLGYSVDWRELRACDYGAPTTRKRLFLVARCDGRPIVWPKPTHGPWGIPFRTAADCIDWSIPCPSIFERERPLADATLRRIARGIVKFVLQNPSPFLIQYHGETGPNQVRGQSIDEPLMVVDASPRYAMISPVFTEHANASSPRCMPADEPLRTICASTKGGHHALVTAFLAKHYGGVTGAKIDIPLGTVTGVDHHSLVACHLLRQFGTSTGSPIEAPAGTIMPGGCGKTALVSAFLSKYYGAGIGEEVERPIGTVTGHDRFGLVTVQVDGETYALADIGMRMLQPRELYRAQGFPEEYVIDLEFGGKPLTKTAQVRMVGNSVCPPVAKAIIRANFHEAKASSRTA